MKAFWGTAGRYTTNVKKLALFFGIFSLGFIPFVVVASSHTLLGGSGAGLVPVVGADGFSYRACDLIALGNNIINFGVAFSVIVATLMFAYAGILYVTAASAGPEQVKKAHGVFINVFVGLLLVLLAWLIVNITSSVISGRGLAEWTYISCIRNPTTAPFIRAEDRGVGSIAVGPNTTSVGALNPRDNLSRVHPDLVRLVNAAHQCSTIPFQVTSGFRTVSQTAPNSRHLVGMAVDAHPIINGAVSRVGGSRTVPNAGYRAINAAFQCARERTGIPFEWGGGSPTFMQNMFYDAMHFQLPRANYPNRP